MNTSVKLIEQRCPSCNAPLQVDTSQAVVTCRYCNNSISIQRAKPARGAPQIAQFGAPGYVPSTVLYIPSGAIGASVATSFIPVLIPFVIMLVVGGGAAFSALGRRFVSLPTVCHTNETLVLTGKTYSGDKPVIEAGINCKLTIKDSTLTSSDVIVKGGINLELRIINSKLKSKTNALDLAATNSKVWISDKSEISGDEAAIKGEGNVELEVKNSSLTGGRDGVDLGSNGKMSFTDSSVKGKEHGIKAGVNAKVTAKNLTVTADEAGIALSSSNGAVDARGLTITSGDTALFIEMNGDVKLADKSALKSTKGDGIAAKSVNMKLLLEDSKVEAKDTALHLAGNADVRLRKGAAVRGDKEGLRADYNLKLSIEGATVESAGPAVLGTSNAEVRVAAGSAVKGTPAFTFNSKPSRFDVAEGTATGETQLGGSGGPSSPSDASAMRRGIEASLAQVKTCKDPRHGTVNVQILVLPTGKVADVRVLSSTASKPAEVCLVSKVRATPFPPRSGTAPVVASYTLD